MNPLLFNFFKKYFYISSYFFINFNEKTILTMKKIFFIFSIIISVYSFGQLPPEFPKKLINKVFCGTASTINKNRGNYIFLDFPYRLTITADGISAEFNPREKFKEDAWGKTQTINKFVEWKRVPDYDQYDDLLGRTIYYKVSSGNEKYSISDFSIYVPANKSRDNYINVKVYVPSYEETTLDANEKLICETLKSKEEIKKEEKERASRDMARRKKSDLELPLVLKKLDQLLISKDTLSIISALQELGNSDLINGNENELNHSKLEVFNDIKRKYDEKVRLENELIEKERVRLENERIKKERVLSYTTNTIIIKKLEIANHDFPTKMNWYDATAACKELGTGWRLPTMRELKMMWYKRGKIGGFGKESTYWSDSEAEYDNVINFSTCYEFYNDKTLTCYARAVRDF
jgi:hypothetical protein